MADLNCITIVGRLTRDAELKHTAGGTAISKSSIAVNRRVKKGNDWTDEASFFDIVLWGKSAEGLNQYLKKGQQVAIAGELRQERWEQDGQKRSRVEIVAQHVQLLSKPQGNNSDIQGASKGEPSNHQYPEAPAFDDDIPF